MKKLVIAAALAGFASTASAGNLAEPVVEPIVVVEETQQGSSGGIVLPLLLLVLVGAALSAS